MAIDPGAVELRILGRVEAAMGVARRRLTDIRATGGVTSEVYVRALADVFAQLVELLAARGAPPCSTMPSLLAAQIAQRFQRLTLGRPFAPPLALLQAVMEIDPQATPVWLSPGVARLGGLDLFVSEDLIVETEQAAAGGALIPDEIASLMPQQPITPAMRSYAYSDADVYVPPGRWKSPWWWAHESDEVRWFDEALIDVFARRASTLQSKGLSPASHHVYAALEDVFDVARGRPIFVMAVTYAVTTPESLELGELEDSGYEVEPRRATGQEVLQEGRIRTVLSNDYQGSSALSVWYTHPEPEDFGTDRDVQHALHVELCARDSDALPLSCPLEANPEEQYRRSRPLPVEIAAVFEDRFSSAR